MWILKNFIKTRQEIKDFKDYQNQNPEMFRQVLINNIINNILEILGRKMSPLKDSKTIWTSLGFDPSQLQQPPEDFSINNFQPLRISPPQDINNLLSNISNLKQNLQQVQLSEPAPSTSSEPSSSDVGSSGKFWWKCYWRSY